MKLLPIYRHTLEDWTYLEYLEKVRDGKSLVVLSFRPPVLHTTIAAGLLTKEKPNNS